MKSLYLLGACALLSTTLFSCTADEFETETQKVIPSNVKAIETGPGDDPVNLPPPPPPKK